MYTIFARSFDRPELLTRILDMVYHLTLSPGRLRLSKSLVCYDLATSLFWSNYLVVSPNASQFNQNTIKPESDEIEKRKRIDRLLDKVHMVGQNQVSFKQATQKNKNYV